MSKGEVGSMSLVHSELVKNPELTNVSIVFPCLESIPFDIGSERDF
jgi:hypothetical protein